MARRCGVGRQQRIDPGGDGVQRRGVLEQFAERDLDAERLLDRRARLGQEERVEAELEERDARLQLRSDSPESSANSVWRRRVTSARRPCVPVVRRSTCSWALVGGCRLAWDHHLDRRDLDWLRRRRQALRSGRDDWIDPVSLALERIRRQRHAPPPRMAVHARPVERTPAIQSRPAAMSIAWMSAPRSSRCGERADGGAGRLTRLLTQQLDQGLAGPDLEEDASWIVEQPLDAVCEAHRLS